MKRRLHERARELAGINEAAELVPRGSAHARQLISKIAKHLVDKWGMKWSGNLLGPASRTYGGDYTEHAVVNAPKGYVVVFAAEADWNALGQGIFLTTGDGGQGVDTMKNVDAFMHYEKKKLGL